MAWPLRVRAVEQCPRTHRPGSCTAFRRGRTDSPASVPPSLSTLHLHFDCVVIDVVDDNYLGRRLPDCLIAKILTRTSTACSTPPPRTGSSSTPPPGSKRTSAKVQSRARRRLLRVFFVRRGYWGAMTRGRWREHDAGFSVDSSVTIGVADRAGRERKRLRSAIAMRSQVTNAAVRITRIGGSAYGPLPRSHSRNWRTVPGL